MGAGCFGPDARGEAAPPKESSSRVAPPNAPEGFSADLGVIEGTVVSTETLPIAGANVSIFEPFILTAVTDEAGRFAFEKLEPGPYSLLAEANGYEPSARKVEVRADETTPATFHLQERVVHEPRSVTFIDDGFLTLQFVGPGTPATNPGGLLTLVPGGLSQDKWSFTHPSDPQLIGYVGALTWTANQYFSARNMTLQANSVYGAPGYFLYKNAGPSPVQLRAVLNESLEARNNVTSIYYLINECGSGAASCVSKPPERWTQIVFQQRFRVYSSLFYVDAPPDNYSPLPDG